MSRKLKLQAGGTLAPGWHIYISRPEDDRLFELLLSSEYVNVLTSRQMGKSSMMMNVGGRLAERGFRFVAIDLAGEMGTPENVEMFYRGLLIAISRDLQLTTDLAAWWSAHDMQTFNQRLLLFFREILCEQVTAPLVIFLDEIDSTLKLPFTDDLFTAIRSMYNDRALVPAYARVAFCLLGVASVNELIKDRRTTPYNVGQTIELSDFDAAREDVSELGATLSDDPQRALSLIGRILHWTGGHPYLTARLCLDLRAAHASSSADVDRYVETTFVTLDRVRNDPNFAQTLRFVETRLTSGQAALRLYVRILRGAREMDVPAVAHNELKLSGLVKPDARGCLIVRNAIYRMLFNSKWVDSMMGNKESRIYRFVAIGCALSTILMGLSVWLHNFQIEDIRALALSPDGQRLSAGLDVWDTESGKLAVRLNGVSGLVTAAAFSPDGRRIVTAVEGEPNRSFLVILWDAKLGKQLGPPSKTSERVEEIAFSPDGLHFATATDSNVGYWDGESGEELFENDLLYTEYARSSSRAVAIGPDHNPRVASSNQRSSAIVLDANSKAVLGNVVVYPDTINRVGLSLDGLRLLLGTERGWSIRDVKSGEELQKHYGDFNEDVQYLAISADGRLLTVARGFSEVMVWDTVSGNVQNVFDLPSGIIAQGTISLLAISGDGRCVAAGLGHRALVWDTKSNRQPRKFEVIDWEGRVAEMLPYYCVAFVFLALVAMLDFFVIRKVVDSGLSTTSTAYWSLIIALLPILGLFFWLIFFGRGRGSTKPDAARP
jgi:AAA domain-containing protein/WD40 domain-containing protein